MAFNNNLRLHFESEVIFWVCSYLNYNSIVLKFDFRINYNYKNIDISILY